MVIIHDRDRLLRMTVYPGMVASESRLLRQYIRRHGGEYDEWRFNVRLGEGVILPEIFDPALRRSFERLTMERPDTVAWRYPRFATLIEVKEFWTNEAVWQLRSYADFYADAFPEHEARAIGVAGDSTPNGRELARRQGIALYLYALPAGPPDVSETAPETEQERPL